jgi:hypothetical protein
MKNLERVLLGSLIIQIILYATGLTISYTSSHNGIGDLSGLGAIVPFGIFGLLCMVNLVLFILYLIYIYKNKKSMNAWLVSFFIINLILALGYNNFINLVDKLPGSDLP